jgi:hypothetical protein
VAALRIWIAATHDRAHRNGGWAFVRDDGPPVGWAGGERRTTRARMALAGLATALKGAASGPVAVTAPATDARVLVTLLKPPEEPPTEDLDLRAELAKLLAGRAWTLAVGAGPDTPVAFVEAWADFASEKAKGGGAFAAAIPKPNLAKIKGL